MLRLSRVPALLTAALSFYVIGCGRTPRVMDVTSPSTGYVVHRESDRVITDLSNSQGVQEGDTLIVFRIEQTVFHPITGKLMRLQLIPVGSVLVDDAGNISSAGRAQSGADDIQAGQFVRVGLPDAASDPWWEEGTAWESVYLTGPASNRVSAIPTATTAERTVRLPGGSTEMRFVWVPGGRFAMSGRRSAPGEIPQHQGMEAAGFWIGIYEVTAEQFHAFVQDQPKADAVRRLPEWFWDENANALDAVRHVDWPTATAFCEWAGFSLPSERQWEYAAKGGKNHAYATPDGQMTEAQMETSSLAVGVQEPNPFGIYDMSGNVWEWCSTKVPGGERVLRGGSDGSPLHEWRTFHKYSWNMNGGGGMTGFRCLLPQPAP